MRIDELQRSRDAIADTLADLSRPGYRKSFDGEKKMVIRDPRILAEMTKAYSNLVRDHDVEIFDQMLEDERCPKCGGTVGGVDVDTEFQKLLAPDDADDEFEQLVIDAEFQNLARG